MFFVLLNIVVKWREIPASRIRVSCSDTTTVTAMAMSTLDKYLADTKRKIEDENEFKTAWKRTANNYFKI